MTYNPCPYLHLKHVDDTTLYSVSYDPESILLQEAVNEVVSWSNTNDMKINTKKTNDIMICFNHQPLEVESIHVDGVELSRIGSVTLLGLRISDSLPWDTYTH